mmetsp:Transcript_3528/g.11024  ORF Transcript_3528/g.11024 Transcript_3528/m.11024 type:complete len:352 (+) Transcript_3528:1681-2736(+)|eukprot:scaffold5312_cov118-Isochrysis_galbana.AAC.5
MKHGMHELTCDDQGSSPRDAPADPTSPTPAPSASEAPLAAGAASPASIPAPTSPSAAAVSAPASAPPSPFAFSASSSPSSRSSCAGAVAPRMGAVKVITTRTAAPGNSVPMSGSTARPLPGGGANSKSCGLPDSLVSVSSASDASPSAVAGSPKLVAERVSGGFMPRPTHLSVCVRLRVVRQASAWLKRVSDDGSQLTVKCSCSPGKMVPSPSPGCTSSSAVCGKKPKRCGSADGFRSTMGSCRRAETGVTPKSRPVSGVCPSPARMCRSDVVSCARSVKTTGAAWPGTCSRIGTSIVSGAVTYFAHVSSSRASATNLIWMAIARRACTKAAAGRNSRQPSRHVGVRKDTF